jgi:predicted membrane channel-forming protein YqfA (hemolysin III family)
MTILLIATSTASFVYFEYTDRWVWVLYLVAIFVLGTWCLLCLWQKKDKLPHNMSFIWIAMFNPGYTCNYESAPKSIADRA